jgi:hypothetical protein
MTEPVRQRAREIAREVVSGAADPNESCALLSELCTSNGWPEGLLAFYALAHEQTGHEHLGIGSQNTAPLIIDACKEFLRESG